MMDVVHGIPFYDFYPGRCSKPVRKDTNLCFADADVCFGKKKNTLEHNICRRTVQDHIVRSDV